MWFKNDGFYIADLLVSLAGWMLITGILVPLLVNVKKQTVEIQEKSASYSILYEYLETIVVEKAIRDNKSIIKGNTQYDILWQEGGSEVCIRYEDVWKQTISHCERIQ